MRQPRCCTLSNILYQAGLGFPRAEQPEILAFELSPPETLVRGFTAAVRRELRKPEFGALAGRVRVLDLGQRIGREETFILDEHLNPARHRVVAEAIVEALSEPPATDPS